MKQWTKQGEKKASFSFNIFARLWQSYHKKGTPKRKLVKVQKKEEIKNGEKNTLEIFFFSQLQTNLHMAVTTS